MKEMMTEAFQPVVMMLLTAAVAAALAYVRKKLKSEKAIAILDEVKECILEGMAEAQEKVVRPAKAASGKLDQVAIDAAESMAMKVAKQVAKGPALKVLKGMSQSRAKSMIKQLLN
jgi:hypothetical protein